MRVLLITSTVSEKSGWGRLSSATAEALRAEGLKVSVLTDEKKRTFGSFIKMCMRARSLAACADAVHALDGWPYGVYGLAAVWGTRKKLFINGIGTYSVAPLYSRARGLLLRLAYSRARNIFCISAYTMNQLKQAGIAASKLIVVHLGTSALGEVPSEYIESVRQANRIPADAYPILLTVGAVKERKGQLDTLKAAALLKATYPNIFYITAGSLERLTYAQEMRDVAGTSGMSERFRAIEHADDQTISALYSLSTVFALNSTTDDRTHHFEGFGLVILEANEQGKPAVGSRGCGIEDAIADGKSGLLCRPGDPQDIAQKIGELVERYDYFAANAKMFAAGFTWQKTVKRYIDFYTQR